MRRTPRRTLRVVPALAVTAALVLAASGAGAEPAPPDPGTPVADEHATDPASRPPDVVTADPGNGTGKEDDFGPVPAAEGWSEAKSWRASYGIDHVEWVRTSPVPTKAQVVRIPADAAARLRVAVPPEGTARQKPSTLCSRYDCAVGVNGDFWNAQGQPEGVLVSDGYLLYSPRPDWFSAAFDPTGRATTQELTWSASLRVGTTVLPLEAVNRLPSENAASILTRRFGSETRAAPEARELRVTITERQATDPEGSTPLTVGELRAGGGAIGEGELVVVAQGTAVAQLEALAAAAGPGGRALVTVELSSALGTVSQALGGAPVLLRDGNYRFWYTDPGPSVQARHPRTLVGWTAAGDVLLVVADGRRPGDTEGLSLPEAAQLLVRLGAIEGLNLDGGGSSTFVVGGWVANRPSDTNGERSVVDALVLDAPTLAVERWSGSTRYGTAAAVARAVYPEGAAEAVVASGERFPDALAGAALGAVRRAPVVLTEAGKLPEETAAVLGELGVRDVHVLGGPLAVEEEVVEQLETIVPGEVQRIAGADRAATSAAVSEAGFPQGATVAYVATGERFPDALAAAAAGAGQPGPLLLASAGALSPSVVAELQRLRPDRIVIVGDETVVPASVEAQLADLARTGGVERVGGPDRYATAALMAERFAPPGTRVLMATGADFPDALAAAAAAAVRGEALLLSPGDCMPEPAMRVADDRDVSALTLVGGPSVLADRLSRVPACPYR